MNYKDENSNMKSTVLVCCNVGNGYGLWCNVEKRMRFEEPDVKMSLGNFYKVEVNL